jgi:hypothetical protein
MNNDLTEELLRRIEALRPMARDLRFGQMLATLEMLGEDMFGRNLWDIEDHQLLSVIERFNSDLAGRANVASNAPLA